MYVFFERSLSIQNFVRGLNDKCDSHGPDALRGDRCGRIPIVEVALGTKKGVVATSVTATRHAGGARSSSIGRVERERTPAFRIDPRLVVGVVVGGSHPCDSRRVGHPESSESVAGFSLHRHALRGQAIDNGLDRCYSRVYKYQDLG